MLRIPLSLLRSLTKEGGGISSPTLLEGGGLLDGLNFSPLRPLSIPLGSVFFLFLAEKEEPMSIRARFSPTPPFPQEDN